MIEQEDYFGPNHKYIIELTSKDFDTNKVWKIKPRKNYKTQTVARPVCGLVLFYAPYCIHCKAVKDEWIRAASMAGFCDFYAFNCIKNSAHADKIKSDLPELITGYPSIIIYRNGEPSEIFSGNRVASDFVLSCTNSCKNS